MSMAAAFVLVGAVAPVTLVLLGVFLIRPRRPGPSLTAEAEADPAES
jgi:hypothetical protein